MKLQLSFFRSGLLLAFISGLYACASSPVNDAQQREAYLQQFIGLSSGQIRNELDLRRIGYRQLGPPVQSRNMLTYSAARTISIPVPMAQNPAMGMGAGSAVPIPSPAVSGYDVNLACHISFQLTGDIAQSVRLSGHTC